MKRNMNLKATAGILLAQATMLGAIAAPTVTALADEGDAKQFTVATVRWTDAWPNDFLKEGVMAEMEEKAATDEMTGLYNKNKLLATIEKRTYDYQQVAIVYWDINRLKYVNDTYGHFAGDQMIVKVAQSIRIALGDAGMAFRYGGDEMLALIPGGTGETAEKMIKTWKQTLAAVQVDCEIPISAAVGYAIGGHEKLKNVIAEADRNMYACKHAGRNSTEK